MKPHNQNSNIFVAILLFCLLAGTTAHAFYNPSLGRWLNRDSEAELGGLNLYGACLNSPANKYDTFGKATEGWVITGVESLLSEIGSKSTFPDLIPKPELGGRYYYDPHTKKVIRVDLGDAAHGSRPNIHVFDSVKDAKNKRQSGRVFFERNTGRLLPVAIISFGIASIVSLDAAVSSGLYQEALAAAQMGDRVEASNKLFELGVEMSIESGSMIPFYAVNAMMGKLGIPAGDGDADSE